MSCWGTLRDLLGEIADCGLAGKRGKKEEYAAAIAWGLCFAKQE